MSALYCELLICCLCPLAYESRILFRHVQVLSVDAFFFKFAFLSYAILCAVSQSTYFAVSYSGKLDRMLERLMLGGACVIYSHRTAVIYTSVAWVMLLLNAVFSLYAIFFSGGFMDIMMAPITTQLNLSDLFIPRMVLFLCKLYLTSAWVFSHAMTLMLASIFHHEFQMLSSSFDKMVAKRGERRLSDSDIATLILRYQRSSLKCEQFVTNVKCRILISKQSASTTRRFLCRLMRPIISLCFTMPGHFAANLSTSFCFCMTSSFSMPQMTLLLS